ncbi:hypothetical protein JCM11251_006356 [Rhodosporidiobolus azoricus]
MLLRPLTIPRTLPFLLPRSRLSIPSPTSPSSRSFSSSSLHRSSAPIALQPSHPQRALLYVPGSSPSARALDSAPADCRSRKYVRINSSKLGFDDLEAVLKSPSLDGLVLPKVHTASDLAAVDSFISQYGLEGHRDKLKIVASIESPLGLLNMREICGVTRRLGTLLFAAEDYCASSSILRTPSLLELTYARQSLVAHARAFGLNAIDLVCVHYKGDEALEVLRRESRQGREWGFGGKQCIHPGQVREVQKAFAPSEEEIDRARRIFAQYAQAKGSGAGAYGLEEKGGGGTVMIDAPMLLQAEGILAQARSAGLSVD